MNLGDFTLSALINYSDHIPMLRGFPERILADSYEKFIFALYQDIERIICNIEENPELRKNDNENRLTIDIVNQLRCIGYDASHDEKIGGHADICVKKNNYIWIGEAKIHSSYPYILQGFQQLCTRYSNGGSNRKEGALIIYIFSKDAKGIMDKWKQHLLDSNEYKDNIEIEEQMDLYRELCFYSKHKHSASGLDFRVKHIPVLLNFDPQH